MEEKETAFQLNRPTAKSIGLSGSLVAVLLWLCAFPAGDCFSPNAFRASTWHSQLESSTFSSILDVLSCVFLQLVVENLKIAVLTCRAAIGNCQAHRFLASRLPRPVLGLIFPVRPCELDFQFRKGEGTAFLLSLPQARVQGLGNRGFAVVLPAAPRTERVHGIHSPEKP